MLDEHLWWLSDMLNKQLASKRGSKSGFRRLGTNSSFIYRVFWRFVKKKGGGRLATSSIYIVFFTMPWSSWHLTILLKTSFFLLYFITSSENNILLILNENTDYKYMRTFLKNLEESWASGSHLHRRGYGHLVTSQVWTCNATAKEPTPKCRGKEDKVIAHYLQSSGSQP